MLKSTSVVNSEMGKECSFTPPTLRFTESVSLTSDHGCPERGTMTPPSLEPSTSSMQIHQEDGVFVLGRLYQIDKF